MLQIPFANPVGVVRYEMTFVASASDRGFNIPLLFNWDARIHNYSTTISFLIELPGATLSAVFVACCFA